MVSKSMLSDQLQLMQYRDQTRCCWSLEAGNRMLCLIIHSQNSLTFIKNWQHMEGILCIRTAL